MRDVTANCSRLWVRNSKHYRAVPIWRKWGVPGCGVRVAPATGWGWWVYSGARILIRAAGYAPVLAVEDSGPVAEMYRAAGLRTLLVRGGADGA